MNDLGYIYPRMDFGTQYDISTVHDDDPFPIVMSHRLFNVRHCYFAAYLHRAIPRFPERFVTYSHEPLVVVLMMGCRSQGLSGSTY